MKLLIAASIIAVLQVSPSVPRKAPAKSNPSAEDIQSKANSGKGIATPPPIKDAEPSPTKAKDGQQVTPGDKQEHVVVERLPDKDIWDQTYIFLTGALVFIGVLTFGAIWYQAKETANAAKATASYTALQKAALRQWVTIQGFREGVEPRFTNTATELDLQLSFEIANPTKMPLTLEWYIISINATKYSSRLNFTLAPDQVHGLKALIRYTDEVRDKYLREGYIITITGVIAYTDALKEFQKQRFGYVRKCGPVRGETLNYQGPLPDEDIEKEESKKG